MLKVTVITHFDVQCITLSNLIVTIHLYQDFVMYCVCSLNEDFMCVFIDNKAWSDVVQDVHNDVYHRCLNMYRYVYGVTDFTVFSLYLCLDDNNEIIYTYRFSTTRAQLSVEFMNSGNYKDCVYLL